MKPKIIVMMPGWKGCSSILAAAGSQAPQVFVAVNAPLSIPPSVMFLLQFPRWALSQERDRREREVIGGEGRANTLKGGSEKLEVRGCTPTHQEGDVKKLAKHNRSQHKRNYKTVNDRNWRRYNDRMTKYERQGTVTFWMYDEVKADIQYFERKGPAMPFVVVLVVCGQPAYVCVCEAVWCRRYICM